MPSVVALSDESAARREPFASDLVAFLASVAVQNQSLAHAHAKLADQMERLLGQEALLARGAKVLRTALRTAARQNRREAWQHLTLALQVRRLLDDAGSGCDLADVAACLEGSH